MKTLVMRMLSVSSFLALSISCSNTPSTCENSLAAECTVCADTIVSQSAGCTFTASATNIVIGSLVAPSTGATAAQASYKAAAELAISDLNAQLSSLTPAVKVQLVEGDLGEGGDDALASLRVLYNQGVRVVVGPSESANVIALRAFAAANGMIIVSNASTATTLSAPNDNIYRMVPDDSQQAAKLANKIVQDGFTNIIVIARGDLYGDDFREALRASFTDPLVFPNNQILLEFQYDPDTDAFGDYAQEWRDAITAITPNTNTTAIVLISFEEVDQIVNSMVAQGSTFFDDYQFYGTDGFSQTDDVINDTEAAGFLLAALLQTTSPAVTVGNQPGLDLFNTRLGASVAGTKSIYAALTYDAVNLVATTQRDLFAKGDTSITAWNADLPLVASGFQGVTGNLAFDANGDRASLPYATWGLAVDAGVYSWVFGARLP